MNNPSIRLGERVSFYRGKTHFLGLHLPEIPSPDKSLMLAKAVEVTVWFYEPSLQGQLGATPNASECLI